MKNSESFFHAILQLEVGKSKALANLIMLLTKLMENINRSFKRPTTDKYKLLDALCGSWSDVDDSIVEDIYHARTTSDKAVNFD